MFSDTGEYDGQPGSLVASCFLIRHPNGDLLWDTGLGDHFAATPGGVEVRPGVRAIVDTPLLAQLKRIGVTPTDIEFLSFSHLHWDHTGNANAYTSSTWMLSRREVEIGRAHVGTPVTTAHVVCRTLLQTQKISNKSITHHNV